LVETPTGIVGVIVVTSAIWQGSLAPAPGLS
jgi:hypothetical protein